MAQQLEFCDIAAEKAVIGSVLFDYAQGMYACQQAGITVDSFVEPAMRVIWKAIEKLHADHKPVDVLTVETQLDADDVLDMAGGRLCCTRLLDATPTIAHCQHYADTVASAHMRRRLYAVIMDAAETLGDPQQDATEIVSGLQNEILASISKRDNQITRLIDYKDAKISQWEQSKSRGFVGIPSCFRDMNQYLGGWRRGSMGLIGGYRGEGKSTYARQEALWQAQQGYHVLFCSLEDPGDIAAASMVGNIAGQSVFGLDIGRYTEQSLQDMSRAWDTTKDLPFWMVANSMTVGQITSTAELIHSRHRLDIIFVDHIQLVSPLTLPGMSRNDTMASYTMQLASLAKRLDVAVVCCSQFSRDSEKNQRKPRLSDLRDSGALEQDARQVLLLYWDGVIECHILEVAKNNYGVSRKVVKLKREDGKQRFSEFDEEEAWRKKCE